MTIKYLFIIMVSGWLSLTGQVSTSFVYKGNNGNVSIISEAPLEIISAESAELRGIVDPANNSFAFQLEVNSLKGFNSMLQQEHFYENYIESEKYPVATFTGKIIEKVDFTKPGIQKIRAKGIFKIHGIGQERIIPCIINVKKDGFQVTSTFNVPLADHNISIPKVVYQKIAEEISVTVDIEFSLSQQSLK